MTFAASPPREGALTRAGLSTTVEDARSFAVPGALYRATIVIGDLLGVVGLVLCVPFVILAIATPIALCLGFLLWIARML